MGRWFCLEGGVLGFFLGGVLCGFGGGSFLKKSNFVFRARI